ncbi:MAG: hypothetical protein K0B01_04445 [Syntrophobacterales bacterium]|nr:hypothetical protein [Syntrophobacterales bacterium]
MGLALDESTPNDDVFENNGVSYVIEKKLLQEVQPIVVEFIESANGGGFQVKSSMSVGGSCGSCSSC